MIISMQNSSPSSLLLLVMHGMIFVACMLLFHKGIVGVISKHIKQPL